MFDSGLRRHSSCASSLLIADGVPSNVPPYKSQGSRDANRDERSKRLHRANSLDPRLSVAQMSELLKLQEQVTNGNYYIAAEASLPNDPDHKMTIVETYPEPEETREESKEEESDGSYVQIRSPTSREKISIVAVIERCRAYQESDEYKQREESKNKTPTSSTDQDESKRTSSNCGAQSIVKNLREKFQNLS